jgi:transposase
MISNNLRFIVGVKNSVKIVSNHIKKFSGDFDNYKYFLSDYNMFYRTKTVYLPFNCRSKNNYDNNIKSKRAFLHIYHDPLKSVEEQNNFYRKIISIQKNLKDKTATISETNFIKNLLALSFDGESFKINIDDDLIKQQTYQYGFFALISNYLNDANSVLSIYRNKDIIEKSFSNLKNRLNLRRTSVHSYENLEGAIFIQFISLILTFYIHNIMKINNLYKNYTLESLLDELDIIERFEYEPSIFHYGEITNKQVDLFKYFGINIKEIIK